MGGGLGAKSLCNLTINVKSMSEITLFILLSSQEAKIVTLFICLC